MHKVWEDLIIIVVQVEAVKIHVAAVEALRKEGMKLSLPPKLVEKLVWVPVISFPVTRLMHYYAETGSSRPLIAWLYK